MSACPRASCCSACAIAACTSAAESAWVVAVIFRDALSFVLAQKPPDRFAGGSGDVDEAHPVTFRLHRGPFLAAVLPGHHGVHCHGALEFRNLDGQAQLGVQEQGQGRRHVSATFRKGYQPAGTAVESGPEPYGVAVGKIDSSRGSRHKFQPAHRGITEPFIGATEPRGRSYGSVISWIRLDSGASIVCVAPDGQEISTLSAFSVAPSPTMTPSWLWEQ